MTYINPLGAVLFYKYDMTCDFRDKILQFDGRAPRYTSYPAAPHFVPVPDVQTAPDWIRAATDDAGAASAAGISLYIHVPFCPKMCWYCGCHTKVTQRYAPVEDYAHLLIREIEILAATLFAGRHDGQGAAPRVRHIHFGGGSPSYLRAQDFDLIMGALRRCFDVAPDAEIAIEIDPRNLSEGRIASYAKGGVNRVSLGVQDFNDMTLKAVNREQPFDLSYQGVRSLREYGIGRINLDIMYGLPHQNVHTIKDTLSKALLLRPDRIAYFGYAHVPWMKKHMRLIDEGALPQQDGRYDLFCAGAEFLQSAGFRMIGIDHFARADDALARAHQNGTLRRNFQGYTTDAAPVMLGIGASSIGYTPRGYLQNHPDMPLYKAAVLAGALPVKKICALAPEDIVRARVIEALMCYGAVDLGRICAEFSLAPDAFAPELAALGAYEDLGFVTRSGALIRIHPDAVLMTRVICTVFDAYFQGHAGETAAPRHAKAI